MEPDDDPKDDRLRYLFARAFEDALPTDACPSPEVVFDAATGALGREERVAVLDHTATCPVCADAWRIATLGRSP